MVHSCYYETYYRGTYITNYESCLAGCCEPSVPGAQKPCCDDTGVIVGICIGVVGFIIVCVAVILYYRRRKRNASKYYLTCSLAMFRVMVLNATFNNDSVILWRKVLLVEKTGVPGLNNRSVVCH